MRDTPLTRGWRTALVVVGVAVLSVAACTGVGDSRSGVLAAYVELVDDPIEASDLMGSITRAAPGEPSEPAGSVEGVMGAFRVIDEESGAFGVRVIFHLDATAAERASFASRAQSLGLRPIMLEGDDEWPDCQGLERCEKVGDSSALPG